MPSPSSHTNPRHKVLFDTDPGIDDAMALYLLHRHPAIELLGITTVHGNAYTEVTTRNALYLCDRFGIDVPVARGAAQPLVGKKDHVPAMVHGDDALGNIGPIATPRHPLDPRPAHRLIIDTVRQYPGEVTLVAVAPLTNLALALKEDPAIAGLVRQVVIMGGAFGVHGQIGNVSPVAEANIICDPYAADQVLTAPWPVVMVGLDVTHQVLMPRAMFERVRDEGGADGQFLWRISQQYLSFYARQERIDGCYVHDASAVAYVIDPSLFQLRSGPIRVVTDGIAVGQTIQNASGRQYRSPVWQEGPAQSVCTEVDADGLLKLMMATLLA
ncbi:nucleoside hydrolase [Paludibacterium purpuratum]|uniref:Inosine-uridine nucleoside N-ribohydrolase n=1 Tax=Paludibacterium purpuratum TaxID=1144873 RepID=A0A4R7B3A7_9NEIS|nr:nucleoside hydrolase [Paludibacterium purpuratum]TDR76455.1 inosine-uridine nucleoside N-ribohydrolase [Paludibacterium purpuratum]